jgi:hypothetical protein
VSSRAVATACDARAQLPQRHDAARKHRADAEIAHLSAPQLRRCRRGVSCSVSVMKRGEYGNGDQPRECAAGKHQRRDPDSYDVADAD